MGRNSSLSDDRGLFLFLIFYKMRPYGIVNSLFLTKYLIKYVKEESPLFREWYVMTLP